MSGGLTPAERRTLAAAMDRILPGGPEGAGADQANAVGYVDWLAGRPDFATAGPCLSMGLALLDSLAAVSFGRAFADCSPAERDEALGRMRAVPHPTVSRAFVMLVRLTLNGMFASPEYGGNADGAGWAFAGFAPHSHTWPGLPVLDGGGGLDGLGGPDEPRRSGRGRPAAVPAQAAAEYLGSGQ
jgi:hypothetical protein